MSEPIKIYSKEGLCFIKIKIVNIMVTESRGRRTPLYAEATDQVLNDLFGVKHLGTKILETRYFDEFRKILDSIDFKAFFEILRYSDNYSTLRSIVSLRYDINKGAVKTKKYEKLYNRAIAALVDDIGIYTDVKSLKYAGLEKYVSGRKADDDDYYGLRSVLDLEDDHRGKRKRHGKYHTTFADMVDDDFEEDDIRLIERRYDAPYYDEIMSPDDDVTDDFAIWTESRKRVKPKSVRAMDGEDDKDEISIINEKLDKLTDAYAHLLDNANVIPNPVQVVQAQPPIYTQSNQGNSDQIISAMNRMSKTFNSSLDKIGSRLDGIEASQLKTTQKTAELFTDIYDKLEDINVPEHITDDSEPGMSNFVRTSNEAMLDDILNRAATGNTGNLDAQ